MIRDLAGTNRSRSASAASGLQSIAVTVNDSLCMAWSSMLRFQSIVYFLFYKVSGAVLRLDVRGV